MKLEEIVKSLKVGEYVKVEQKEAALIRVVKLWRTDEGKYNFIFDGYNFSNEFETAEEVLKSISENFGDKFLTAEYEIYKTRAELKAENAKLEKALKSACEIIADCENCLECPANNFCLENSDGTCEECIYNELMKEAEK